MRKSKKYHKEKSCLNNQLTIDFSHKDSSVSEKRKETPIISLRDYNRRALISDILKNTPSF